MARYRLTEEPKSAVAIEITEVAGKRDQLLGALAACKAGECSCPTDEYKKLNSMDIDTSDDRIRLRLEPKSGEKFDLSEIAACLDYTTAKATAS